MMKKESFRRILIGYSGFLSSLQSDFLGLYPVCSAGSVNLVVNEEEVFHFALLRSDL